VSLILNIDTAVQTASVCLSENDKPIAVKVNPSQKDHASWLQPAIKEIIDEQSLKISYLDAISISEGPGSYTGLRVGMASAKGLCFALGIPLITINTLQMMAVAALNEPTTFLCPMIDARRMEVFTALFNKNLEQQPGPVNVILDETFLQDVLSSNTITFFGNGSEKWKGMVKSNNACFKHFEATAEHMAGLSYIRLKARQFADLAYAEPFYGKDFHSTVKQST
jgi:tRNA threonylcarbamoyladenosine biosynthesis protein TsaB